MTLSVSHTPLTIESSSIFSNQPSNLLSISCLPHRPSLIQSREDILLIIPCPVFLFTSQEFFSLKISFLKQILYVFKAYLKAHHLHMPNTLDWLTQLLYVVGEIRKIKTKFLNFFFAARVCIWIRFYLTNLMQDLELNWIDLEFGIELFTTTCEEKKKWMWSKIEEKSFLQAYP